MDKQELAEMYELLKQLKRGYEQLFEHWNDICFRFQRQPDKTIIRYQMLPTPIMKRAKEIMENNNETN